MYHQLRYIALPWHYNRPARLAAFVVILGLQEGEEDDDDEEVRGVVSFLALQAPLSMDVREAE